MSYKQKAEKLANNLGCIIRHAEQGCITCEAPAGYSFGDVHEYVYEYESRLLVKEKAWQAMYKDLLDGVIKCNVKNCDWCLPE